MTQYRFAILAGVSSDRQANEDKKSIPEQVKACRLFIDKTIGGIETAGPFIMDGYSRTGYDSLEIAMNDIPPLAEAIRAAENNQYDILLLDNFDRLGDLGPNMLTRFNRYRKQLHSIRQSGRIYDPASYDPYENEFADISMAYERMIQKYRISKMQRGWKVGVPARIQRGLAPGNAPFGYSPVNTKEPHQQNEFAPLVVRMKDLFLQGYNLTEIARMVQPYIPHRRMNGAKVGIILKNPYYAGKVVLFKTRRNNDARIETPRTDWLIGQGKHVPLWDEDTYNRILTEFEKRYTKKKSKYPLTGLFVCADCGQRLRHFMPPSSRHWHSVRLACPDGHVGTLYDKAIDLLADALRRELESRQIHPADRTKEIDNVHDLIRKAQGRRQRIQDGYESDPPLYTAKEASERLRAIEDEVASLRRQEERLMSAGENVRQMEEVASSLDLSRLGDWMRSADPSTVNRLLSRIVKSATMRKGGTRYEKHLKLELWD